MIVTVKKKDDSAMVQPKMAMMCHEIMKQRQQKKKVSLRKTAGTVIFDKSKSPLEVQKEIRGERN